MCIRDSGDPTQIYGVSVPLPDTAVLSSEEIAETQEATAYINNIIETMTAQQGWAFFDANNWLAQTSISGYPFDDYVLTSDLVFGGLFSLDGVHPTPRGYAAIANEMMATIDSHYGSNLSDAKVKAGDYPTNFSPNLR